MASANSLVAATAYNSTGFLKLYNSTGFLKLRGNLDPIIEDETITIPVLGPTVFKVTQNSSADLINLTKALFTHPGCGFFTTHPTSAKPGFHYPRPC